MAVSGKEPALRQIRLRWWADQLALTGNGTVPPEPLLAEVAALLAPPVGGAALAALAEAWMDAADPVGDQPPPTAHGAQLFAITATLLDQGALSADQLDRAGRLWAAVRAARHHDASVAAVVDPWAVPVAEAVAVRPAGLPRPLAVLTALARAVALRRGERRWRREQLLVLRVGLFGR